MRVEFTEFVRPHAEQRKFHIILDDAVIEQHAAMVAAGGRLTMENLGNKTINVCIEKPGVCDYKMEIVKDHIRFVAAGFEKMLKEFDAAEFEAAGE